MFDHPIIMHPSSSPSSSLHMYDPYTPSKVSPGHLYVRQPHAIQIIQLVEGPPPPPRRISSVVYSSSAGSSSSSYPCTSDAESEQSEDECSSYCSSYMTPEQSSEDHEMASHPDDTFAIRMKRVYDWREKFAKAMGASPGPSPSSSPLKRKTYPCETDNDNLSQSSKRSRSRDEQSSPTLSVHSCAACDASFPSRQSLRQHGRTSQASDACRIAVEYDFE